MKSHVSTLLEIAKLLIRDVFALCAVSESAERDIQTLMSRVEHEGLSFLTISLPSFGSDFERSLDEGAIDSTAFRSFRKAGKIPAFLRGISSLVFDADTGRIKNDPLVEAIKGIRQVAYAFKKLKLPCAPSRVRKAFEGYIQDERDLESLLSEQDTEYFSRVCDCLWNWMSRDPSLDPFTTIPKHGPGATAERITGNSKYVFRSWHNRLEPYFPLDSNAFVNTNALDTEEFEKLTIVSETDELPVRVITVPKTLKAPRIIAIEPVCMQYTQQALAKVLERALERNRFTAGHVNFTDQSINQNIALCASKDKSKATLDMSSASDRVPAMLVYIMLSSNPDFRDAAFSCRSSRAQLPSGQILSLRKFASMGSALCFPIESMYFYTLCVGALLESRNLPVTSRNVFDISRDVYVYGDDIIVPADEAATVTSFLRKYFCRVNMSKSFWIGKFRESCGMDAYDGMRVTPTYIRELPPSDRRDAPSLISWVKTANLLNEEGLFLTSSYIYSLCERIIGKLPIIQEKSSALGRVTLTGEYSIERWNKRLHRPEVRAWVASPVYQNDKLEGYPALLKCLLRLEHAPFSKESVIDEKHLQKTARYGAVTLKRRWVQPF